MNITRFMAKVDRWGGCWIWTGALNSRGYGSFGVDGSSQLAHRLSVELFMGPIPSGKLVCHRCDTPACIKPSHLFVGTQVENMSTVSQLRDNPKYGRRKYSREEIVRLAGEGIPMWKIAIRMKCSESTVERAINDRR